MARNRLFIFLLIIIGILFGVIFFLSINRDRAIPIPPTVASTIQPTVWITQVITQIVATVPSPTPTLIPTPTPFPTPTLEWDPFSVPFYFPLIDCSASRLKKGDMSFVGYLDKTLRIAKSNQIFADPGIRNLVLGEWLHITNGPICEQRHVIWEVRAISDDVVGFVPEGNGETYWLFPAAPSVPTPRRLKP